MYRADPPQPVAGRCAVSGARNNRPVKLRRLREGDVLDDGDVVLVRGGELDPDVLRADALRYHSIYGTYGISVFAIRGATLDEMAQQVPLIRFERLTLLKVRKVVAAGLRLEPTGRSPRHYTVGFDDLDEGVRRLGGCGHQVMRNPFHDA
jgi:hypothetical protein